MKKEELVKQLEAAKALSSQVDIDKVIALINQIESGTKAGLTQELAEEIANRIERTLDYNASDLVDKDDVTFNITYGNVIEIDDASINVSETMDHIAACLDEFIVEEDDEVELEQNEGMEEIIS
jgi:LytS/YehU family sensor histidine kinase